MRDIKKIASYVSGILFVLTTLSAGILVLIYMFSPQLIDNFRENIESELAFAFGLTAVASSAITGSVIAKRVMKMNLPHSISIAMFVWIAIASIGSAVAVLSFLLPMQIAIIN